VIEELRAPVDNPCKSDVSAAGRGDEMLRLWLIAMLAAALLGVARSHDVLHRTGLIGYCTAATTPAGAKGHWRVCEKGRLDGRPDLTRRSCRSRGMAGRVEYWSCPAAVERGLVG
jgi:hypothetical protein